MTTTIQKPKTLPIGLLIAAVLTLSACATVEGAGKDITTAGKSIEKAADRASQ